MSRKSLDKIWEQVPVTYYQEGVKRNIFQKIWHSYKIRLAKENIARLKFTNCLDVGCASGFMVSEISKSFPNARYFGIDSYHKAINYAQKNYPGIGFKTASAHKLPFPGSFFDLILCFETIEHIEDPQVALKEMRRVLRNNGVLLLAMDSGSWLFRLVWSVWEKTYGKVWKNSHLHPFRHIELDKIVLQSGFKIEKKILSHLGMEVVYILTKDV